MARSLGTRAAGLTSLATLKDRRRQRTLEHDAFNLLVLPWFALIALAGYLERPLMQGETFALVLTAYFILDFIWVLVVPSCVPKANIILLHHCVTLALMTFPLRFPEKQGYMLVYKDVMVEFNTAILLARRLLNVKNAAGRLAMEALHWSSLIKFPAIRPLTIQRVPGGRVLHGGVLDWTVHIG